MEGVIVEGRAYLMGIRNAFKVVDVLEEGGGGSTDFVVGELDAPNYAFVAR